MNRTRNGDWMQTFTGRQFWPIDPTPNDIFIEDIAHALSMMCRYGGHTLRFYSVAEHCCHLYDVAPKEHRLWALLHDASEAYIVDIIRPLKPFLSEYKFYEKAIMNCVARRFGMSENEPPIVKELDGRILADEAAQLMAEPPAAWTFAGEPLGVLIQCWSPQQAEMEFLRRFVEEVVL